MRKFLGKVAQHWHKGSKRKGEVTSAKVASEAGRILNDPASTPEQKSVAGSALTQRRDKLEPKN